RRAAHGALAPAHGGDRPRPDVGGAAGRVDLSQQSGGPVRGEQRLGLAPVDRETPCDDLGPVVLPLLPRTALRPAACDRRGVVEVQDPRLADARAEPAPAEAMQDLVVRHLERQHYVDRTTLLREQGIERAGLVEAARVAVEQETGAGMHRRQTGTQQLLDDRVGNELTALDVARRGAPERGPGLDLRAQQVAGGDALEREALDERRHERALARARRSDEHDLKWRR